MALQRNHSCPFTRAILTEEEGKTKRGKDRYTMHGDMISRQKSPQSIDHARLTDSYANFFSALRSGPVDP